MGWWVGKTRDKNEPEISSFVEQKDLGFRQRAKMNAVCDIMLLQSITFKTSLALTNFL